MREGAMLLYSLVTAITLSPQQLLQQLLYGQWGYPGEIGGPKGHADGPENRACAIQTDPNTSESDITTRISLRGLFFSI
jgi:hypothetical protein